MKTKKKAKTIRPIRPSAAIEAMLRQRLRKLIEEMDNSIVYWLKASYRANEPVMAQDAPADSIHKALRALQRQWQKRFNAAAPKLADYFATDIANRTDKALASILEQGGISVKFKMTKAMRDVLAATIRQNVGLIRSIPQQHLSAVEGIVMRSVQDGRNLAYVAKELQKQFGVTKRRAALIARHQNNMATAALQRVRYLELGVKRAVWLHSGGGKHPRPTHVANSGKSYDVKTGWYDPHEKKRIWPGQLIGCRCVSKIVMPMLGV